MDEDVLQREAAKAFGKLGGIATREKYGADHYRKLQQKSVEAKKRKKKTDS